MAEKEKTEVSESLRNWGTLWLVLGLIMLAISVFAGLTRGPWEAFASIAAVLLAPVLPLRLCAALALILEQIRDRLPAPGALTTAISSLHPKPPVRTGTAEDVRKRLEASKE